MSDTLVFASFLPSPQVLRVGLVLVELDLGSLSLSFGSAWIAESKVQLISFMATYVGVMIFTLCTQKQLVKMDIKCTWFMKLL